MSGVCVCVCVCVCELLYSILPANKVTCWQLAMRAYCSFYEREIWSEFIKFAQRKAILYSEWREQTSPSFTHTPLHSYLPEEIYEWPHLDVYKNMSGCSKVKCWVGRKSKWRERGRKIERVVRESQRLSLATIRVCYRPAIMGRSCITNPALWLVQEAGLSWRSTIS